MAFCVRSERNLNTSKLENISPGPGAYIKLTQFDRKKISPVKHEPLFLRSPLKKTEDIAFDNKITDSLQINNLNPTLTTNNMNINQNSNTNTNNSSMFDPSLFIQGRNEKLGFLSQVQRFAISDNNHNLLLHPQLDLKLGPIGYGVKLNSDKKSIDNKNSTVVSTNLSNSNNLNSSEKYKSNNSSKIPINQQKLRKASNKEETGSLSRIISIPSKVMNGYIVNSLGSYKTINSTSSFNNDNDLKLIIDPTNILKQQNYIVGPGSYENSLKERSNVYTKWERSVKESKKKESKHKKDKLLEELKKNGDYNADNIYSEQNKINRLLKHSQTQIYSNKFTGFLKDSTQKAFSIYYNPQIYKNIKADNGNPGPGFYEGEVVKKLMSGRNKEKKENSKENSKDASNFSFGNKSELSSQTLLLDIMRPSNSMNSYIQSDEDNKNYDIVGINSSVNGLNRVNYLKPIRKGPFACLDFRKLQAGFRNEGVQCFGSTEERFKDYKQRNDSVGPTLYFVDKNKYAELDKHLNTYKQVIVTNNSFYRQTSNNSMQSIRGKKFIRTGNILKLFDKNYGKILDKNIMNGTTVSAIPFFASKTGLFSYDGENLACTNNTNIIKSRLNKDNNLALTGTAFKGSMSLPKTPTINKMTGYDKADNNIFSERLSHPNKRISNSTLSKDDKILINEHKDDIDSLRISQANDFKDSPTLRDKIVQKDSVYSDQTKSINTHAFMSSKDLRELTYKSFTLPKNKEEKLSESAKHRQSKTVINNNKGIGSNTSSNHSFVANSLSGNKLEAPESKNKKQPHRRKMQSAGMNTQYPGPGSYNIGSSFIKPSFSNAKFKGSCSPRFLPQKTIDEEPGPENYDDPGDVNYKYRNITKNYRTLKKSQFELDREKKLLKLRENRKYREQTPGVGSYQPEFHSSIEYQIYNKLNPKQSYQSPFLLSSARFEGDSKGKSPSPNSYLPSYYDVKNIARDKFSTYKGFASKSERFSSSDPSNILAPDLSLSAVGPGSYDINADKWNKKTFNVLFLN